MKLSRRKFLCSLALSSLSLPRASFGRETDNAKEILIREVKKLAKGKKITLRVLYPKGSKNNITPVTELFTKGTGIDFNLIETSVDDISTKILLDTLANNAAFDIALPATFGIPDLVEGGALLDFTDFAKYYEKLINYRSSLYDLGDRYNGKVYGYQTDGDAYLMFYNPTLFKGESHKKRFEDLHGEELTIPRTWAELDRAMRFFHAPEDNRFGGCLFRQSSYIVWEWWIRFHAKRALPFSEEFSPNIASAEGVAALEELMEASNYQHDSAASNSLFENWKEFSRGQSAVNIGWGGTQKYLRNQKLHPLNNPIVAPTPETSYFNWGWNYVASTKAQIPEVAYLFCLFATLPSTSTLAVRNAAGFFDPFRIEHYTDEEIIMTYGENFLSAHKQAMKNSIPDLYMKGRGQYMQALEEGILLANEGHVVPEKALKIVNNRWREITQKEGKEKQRQQWRFLLSKYPHQT